jgi:hypothetical protein
MAKDVKVSGYARVTKSASGKTVKVTSVSGYTRKKPKKG